MGFGHKDFGVFSYWGIAPLSNQLRESAEIELGRRALLWGVL